MISKDMLYEANKRMKGNKRPSWERGVEQVGRKRARKEDAFRWHIRGVSLEEGCCLEEEDPPLRISGGGPLQDEGRAYFKALKCPRAQPD